MDAGVYSLTFYVNGIEDFSDSKTDTFYRSSTNQFLIGNQNAELGETRQFGGAIDEVRVSLGARYTGTFTPEVTLTADSDTVAHWSFDEGEGATAHDSSTFSYDGTIEGASWVESCPSNE